ncbi:MAG: PKD domain-containing protein [FCB group bacterium]|nr:PKD domain-containing protein [FCB group bacterium]
MHSCSSYFQKQLNKILTALIFLLILLIIPPTTFSQLTSKDIKRLREEGKREGWTFTVDENPATKIPLEQLCGLKEPPYWRKKAHFNKSLSTMNLPAAFDWREHNGTTPIKNQGACGSCWAFGTVGPLECAIKIRDGKTVDLSEQWLVSCNAEGWGCAGGWMAQDYFQWKGDPCGDAGAVLESEFPYAAKDLSCGCPYDHPYKIYSWAYIGSENGTPTVDQMKQAILEYGPISVSVYANSAMQAYSGGVFNGCGTGTINHAVVLVGWDDTQGPNGIWIMRNSWGAGWGENGYIRIPYGCSKIGYAACYIDYGISGIFVSSDTTCGPAPLSVNFDASSPLEQPNNWVWHFGDGDSSHIQSPSHIYQQPGVYNVVVQVDAGGTTHTQTKESYIVAYADTAKADSTRVIPGSTAEIIITANNTAPVKYLKIPVEYAGDFNLSYDSISTVGCRTNYFETQTLLQYDPFSHHLTIKLVSSNNGSSPELPPGNGPVVKLYLSVPSTATSGQTVPILLDGYTSGNVTYSAEYQGIVANYDIATTNGMISIKPCVVRGDIDNDGKVDVTDIFDMINYYFNGGNPLPNPAASDVDCSETNDVDDLLYMIKYIFNNGPEPCGCG